MPLAVHLQQFLKVNRVDLVLDVGACDGAFCRLLRSKCGYTGRIVSFEPVATTFARLKSAMRGDSLWVGYNLALGSSKSRALLSVFDDHPDMSSFFDLTPQAAHSYDVKQDSARDQECEVETLASMWHSLVDDGVNVFLKTDTQGSDLAVIKGAMQYLPRIVGILSEMSAISLYRGMPTMSETLRYLTDENKFIPLGFYPVNSLPSFGGAVPEFDVLLGRSVQ